jgi:hypothetical protein
MTPDVQAAPPPPPSIADEQNRRLIEDGRANQNRRGIAAVNLTAGRRTGLAKGVNLTANIGGR